MSRYVRMVVALMTLVVAMVASAAPKSPVRLTVSVPPQVRDDRAVIVSVELENRDARPGRVAPLSPGTVTLNPMVVFDAGSGKCHTQALAATLGSSIGEPVVLAAGATLRATFDLTASYPFGLRPGRYVLAARYEMGSGSAGLIESEAVPLEITTPTGPEAEMYEAFLDVCARVQRFELDAQARALAFAKASPQFVYARALASQAMTLGESATSAELAAWLQETHPGTIEARLAAVHAARAGRVEEQRAAYAAYLAAYEAAMRDPANAASAQAKRQLGTILDTDAFERHERFLRQFPDSPFAPEVLHGMIEAASRGLTPAGRDAAQAETLLFELYRRLATEYPASYRAQEALAHSAISRTRGAEAQ